MPSTTRTHSRSASPSIAESAYKLTRIRGFYILNALRACTITSLLTTIVAALATLVKSFTVSKFFFFDALSHLLLTAICTFLLLSEVSLASTYFSTSWPLFARDASLVWSGLAQIAVACALLSDLNEEYVRRAKLGVPINALVLAGGVVGAVMGICNFIASFIFRRRTVTARMVRSIRLFRIRRSDARGERRGMEMEAGGVELQTPERAYSRGGGGGSWGKTLRGGYGAESPASFRPESVYSRAPGGSVRDPRERAEEYQRALSS